MKKIYHITEEKAWEQAKKSGTYRSISLSKEGFINCSTKDQVIPTANRRFGGFDNLLLLEINPKKIGVKIVYEDLSNLGEKHPHIYGALPIEAVEEVLKLSPDQQGNFSFPKK